MPVRVALALFHRRNHLAAGSADALEVVQFGIDAVAA